MFQISKGEARAWLHAKRWFRVGNDNNYLRGEWRECEDGTRLYFAAYRNVYWACWTEQTGWAAVAERVWEREFGLKGSRLSAYEAVLLRRGGLSALVAYRMKQAARHD